MRKVPPHLVGRVGREQRQLDVEVVLPKIDDGILVGVRALQDPGGGQVGGVMVVERIRANERVDETAHLGQPKSLSEGGPLWPGRLEGSAHVEIAAAIPHLHQAAFTQIHRDHLLELQISGADELRHLCR